MRRIDRIHTEEAQFVESAIVSIRPKAEFTVGEAYDSLTWHSVDQEKPTEAEFDTALANFKLQYSGNEYARNRELEYPSIDELTVALYDTDDKAALETKRAVVKTKWPKDNSGPVE